MLNMHVRTKASMKYSVGKVLGWSNHNRWFNPLKVLREQLDGPDRLRVFFSTRTHRKKVFLRSPPPPNRHCQVQLVTFSKQNTQRAGYEVQLNIISGVPLQEHGEACSDMSPSTHRHGTRTLPENSTFHGSPSRIPHAARHSKHCP